MVNVGRKPKKKEMELGLKRVINIYHTRGLRVTQLNTDNEFECIREEVRAMNMNIVAARENAGDIERLGRTVKEGTRCHLHQFMYTNYPTKDNQTKW